MPIDFSLSPEQRAVRQRARDLARDVLTAARDATHRLATPEQRFVASRSYYRALVQAGLLRRLIPPPLGGEMTGLVDLAIEPRSSWPSRPACRCPYSPPDSA